MATYQPRNGNIRALIRSAMLEKGSISKTFPTLKEAKAWVKKEEAKIALDQHVKSNSTDHTLFSKIIEHHRIEILKIPESEATNISDKKKRKKFNELARLKVLFQGYTLAEMTPKTIAGYMAKRLITDGVVWDTVKRDMQDITSVLETAVYDLEFDLDSDVVKKGVKVFDKRHKTVERIAVKRTRRLHDDEYERLCDCTKKYATVALFAVETAMRRGSCHV